MLTRLCTHFFLILYHFAIFFFVLSIDSNFCDLHQFGGDYSKFIYEKLRHLLND